MPKITRVGITRVSYEIPISLARKGQGPGHKGFRASQSGLWLSTSSSYRTPFAVKEGLVIFLLANANLPTGITFLKRPSSSLTDIMGWGFWPKSVLKTVLTHSLDLHSNMACPSDEGSGAVYWILSPRAILMLSYAH